jgi:hypothetical protein
MPRARLFRIALSVFGVLLVGGTVPSGGGSAALLGNNALMVAAYRTYNAPKVRFSTTVGEKPEIEVALV